MLVIISGVSRERVLRPPGVACPRVREVGDKINVVNKEKLYPNFNRFLIFEAPPRPKKEIRSINVISKLILSVRAGLCGYFPPAPKNVSAPMMIKVLCVVKNHCLL